MKIDDKIKERIRHKDGLALITTADEAAKIIEDGMVVGVSGFTPSGYPKAVPPAIAARVEHGDSLKIDLYSGASVGPEIDTLLTEAGAIGKRLPYLTNSTIRKAINTGEIEYLDMHLSHLAQSLNFGAIPKVDVAIIEALAITENGDIIPTTSVGNSPTFIQQADQVIVELNLRQPLALEGMHDIFMLENPPNRKPIPLCHVDDRIGNPYMQCGFDKIAAIVVTDLQDQTRPLTPLTDNAKKIAEHIIEFLQGEVDAGRLTSSLLPIQSGVGSVANAVLYGLLDSDFHDLTCYTEVVQDSMLTLLKEGKAKFASTTAISPSPEAKEQFDQEVELYKDKLIFRPQEISNNPEVARRLGIIAMNTALEVDIYGNVNSTHVMGSQMMNGIGGSGDFSRNGSITMFTTESLAKDGDISSIVPMVSHVDHTEHDVMVIVTEQGYADLRGLSPKERAMSIINNCAHPDYRPKLMDYFQRACEVSPLHTPHLLDEALSWHINYQKTGSMK